jgi:hypothetical protein
MKRDEEHSIWQVSYRDSTNAERVIGAELAMQPEFKKLRTVAKQIARHNHPPFTVVNDGNREVLTGWRELLAHIKAEGMRDAQVQRYKGLGRNECRAALGNNDESREAHPTAGSARRSGGMREHLLHVDGR